MKNLKIFGTEYTVHKWKSAFDEIDNSNEKIELCGLENWKIETRASKKRKQHIVGSVSGENRNVWQADIIKYFSDYVINITPNGCRGFEDDQNKENLSCVQNFIESCKNKAPNSSPTFIHVTSVTKLINKSENGRKTFMRFINEKRKRVNIELIEKLKKIPDSPQQSNNSRLTDVDVNEVFKLLSKKERCEIIKKCLPYEADKLLWFSSYIAVSHIIEFDKNWANRLRDALGLVHYSENVWLTIFRVDIDDFLFAVRPTVIEMCNHPLYPCFHPAPRELPLGVTMDLIENNDDAVIPLELIHYTMRLENRHWLEDYIGRVTKNPRVDIDNVRRDHKKRLRDYSLFYIFYNNSKNPKD